MPLPTIPDGLHTSVSQMKCFLRCPRQYELKYVLGIQPQFLPVNLALGLAFHGAAAALYSEIKATGKLPPLEMLVDTFRDAWSRASEGPLPLQGDEDEPVDTGAVTDKGVEMASALHTHVAKTMNGHVVDGVEVPFVAALHDPDTGEVLDEQFVGTMDLVLRHGTRRTVVELKTASRRWSADNLTFDLQPTGYKFAARQVGLGDVKLRLDIVTKAKEPQVQVAEVERGPRDEDDFLRTAVGVLRAVDAGVAYPVRGWACRGCQFAHACKPKLPKLALVA
jgi:CRISPR/Cas system-associated exonuclease Cas4 (RecB family)